MTKRSLKVAVLVAGGLVVIVASADAATGGQAGAALSEAVGCACEWVQSLFG